MYPGGSWGRRGWSVQWGGGRRGSVRANYVTRHTACLRCTRRVLCTCGVRACPRGMVQRPSPRTIFNTYNPGTPPGGGKTSFFSSGGFIPGAFQGISCVLPRKLTSFWGGGVVPKAWCVCPVARRRVSAAGHFFPLSQKVVGNLCPVLCAPKQEGSEDERGGDSDCASGGSQSDEGNNPAVSHEEDEAAAAPAAPVPPVAAPPAAVEPALAFST
jgi:hypothetical protein